jgi:hypothetical protein
LNPRTGEEAIDEKRATETIDEVCVTSLARRAEATDSEIF